MKVLLVQSYLGGKEQLVYPIGAASVGAALHGTSDVRAIDLNLCANPFEDLKALVKSYSPDVVGISLRNIDSTNKRTVVFYYGFLKQTVETLKEAGQARIVIGGSGFSMFAKEIMRDEPSIDLGVYLEGERTFPALLRKLDDPASIKGVYYRKGGEPVLSGLPEQTPMNEIRLPDRSLFDLKRYANVPDAIGVETKRGCMLSCIYCIYGFLNGRKLRMRDPEKIVDEVAELSRKGIKSFTFVDAVFNIPVAHAEAVCSGLIKRGLTKMSWSAWFHERFLNESLVDLVRRAGCTKVILSPDGFSDEVLKNLGKDLKKDEIIRSFDLLKGAGMEVCYNFFKNPPGQDFSTFIDVMKFCFRTKRTMKRKVHFEFNSMRIEPHTRLHALALDQGLISREDNLLYPKYYRNPKAGYIEGIYNAMLRLKGR